MVYLDPAVADGDAKWIDALRYSLDRGLLIGIRPFKIGDGSMTMSAESIVRIMLADLDRFNDLSPEDRPGADHEACRRELLNNLKQIHEMIACMEALLRRRETERGCRDDRRRSHGTWDPPGDHTGEPAYSER